MDIHHQPDGSLLLTYDSTRWMKWLIGATLEQVRFRFDAASRLIEWDQRWAFRRRAGITVGYKPDVDGSISRTADTLRLTLGHRPPTTEDSVRLMISQGRTIDAVKLLRETEGMSLTDATQRVDQMRATRL